ncbi:MAG TPA: hypothetical protein IAD33_11060 [Candidatus Scatomorpha gallistercoris]|nr:hypothetical protein [Candidatus Scatomorpha gallistercoris]
MSGSNNKRSEGAAVKVVLTGFVLLTMAATGFSMFSGCGVDDGGAVASNPPPAVSSTESPQATPQPSPSTTPAPEQTEPSATPQATPKSNPQTAAGVGLGSSVTVPESEAVDDSYFADAVFVGDSRTEGLKMYSGLDSSQFFSSVGMDVDKVFTDQAVSLNGQLLTVAQALEQASYSKVYIMLGMNELGWVYESVFADNYARIIDTIRESHPDATIYVQSILPVSQWKDGSNDIYTNANVVRLQKALVAMCEEKGVNYVNVAEGIQDEQGYLPSESTQDGVHLTPEYCQRWMDYLKTHTA